MASGEEDEYGVMITSRGFWLVIILALVVAVIIALLCANTIVQDHDYYVQVNECVKSGQTVNACTDALRNHAR